MTSLKDLTIKEVEKYIQEYKDFLREEGLEDDSAEMHLGVLVNYTRWLRQEESYDENGTD